MYGGYGGYGAYGGGMGPGMMMPSSLEIPLKDGACSVKLMTVHPGKMVLSSRADYENLWKHLSKYREANQFDSEEAYQEHVSTTYFGMPGYNNLWKDGNPQFKDGQHPYWWGDGVAPMYKQKQVDPISRELLDRKQIDETIVYAPQGNFYSKITMNPLDTLLYLYHIHKI